MGASSVPATRPSASITTWSAYAGRDGIVRDHHHCVPVLVDQLAKELEDVASCLGVEGSGRLVGEHDLGARDQRPGDRDALLLPTGKLRGAVAKAIVKSDPGRDLTHRRTARPAPVEPQRQGDVLRHRERREQIEGLKDEADPFAPQQCQPPLAQAGQVGVAERDGARGGPVQPRRDVQERALPRPGWAHYGGE